jgi:pyruvate dehydrogenase E2 component (dihydrolipoamide acetyltransferase)
MSEITMPKLSDSMEEGTILKWLRQDGQSVAPDEDLVEIETDKATMTYAAEARGTLHIVAVEGSTLPVGAVIAHLGAAVNERPVTAGGDPVATRDTARAATPLARRTAQTHGVALEQLGGSGPRGRITRADVLAAAGTPEVSRAAPKSALAQPPSPEEPSIDGFEMRQPTRAQQVMARRMVEANATIPDFGVQTEVIMDETLAMRRQLKELADEDGAPSINDCVVKACALALRHHPRVNASYAEGQFKLHRRVNVGVAVATDEALIVPTVYDADAKSLGTIAQETRRLAERVRAETITPPELSGGTFTISNLGMFGMTAIRPVINPPQAAILGVGAIRDTLARIDGEIADRRLMTLTLTADHRVLSGADAARFLDEVRALLQVPLKLVL